MPNLIKNAFQIAWLLILLIATAQSISFVILHYQGYFSGFTSFNSSAFSTFNLLMSIIRVLLVFQAMWNFYQNKSSEQVPCLPIIAIVTAIHLFGNIIFFSMVFSHRSEISDSAKWQRINQYSIPTLILSLIFLPLLYFLPKGTVEKPIPTPTPSI